MTDVRPRVAIVTGGESGIGAACVRALANDGCDVALLCHKDQHQAERGAAAARSFGRKAISIQTDISVEKQVEAAFDQTIRVLGTPSILVNSAGINQAGIKVADMTSTRWKEIFSIDLNGAFVASRRLVRELAKATGTPGRIINITSIHAEAARAGAADYCAAKAALRSFTEVLALEVARQNITVNAVAPGMILTPMNEKAEHDAAYRASLEANVPVGRAGTAAEVADLVVYLASDKAAYITGTTITIDGALSLLLGQGA